MNDKMFAAVYIESTGSKKRWKISKSFVMEEKNMKRNHYKDRDRREFCFKYD